jgi:hypothetical protein
MTFRFQTLNWLAVAVVAALPGCRASGGGDDFPDAADGRMVVAWRGGARLLDAAARALYCAGDSVLVIVALDTEWGAGLALRGRFPVGAARAFAVRPRLGEDGTAAAAFRSVADSVHRAVFGLRGFVRIEPGGQASGRFAIGAAPLPGHSDPLHLVGTFRTLPTSDTSATCGAWSRNP